jgi:hypothetical protein
MGIPVSPLVLLGVPWRYYRKNWKLNTIFPFHVALSSINPNISKDTIMRYTTLVALALSLGLALPAVAAAKRIAPAQTPKKVVGFSKVTGKPVYGNAQSNSSGSTSQKK